MKGRHSIVVAASALALVAIGALVISRGPVLPDTPAAADKTSATAVAPGNSASTVQRVPDGPFDVMRPRLEAAAQDGDADAAYRIGKVLTYCLNYSPITSSRLTGMIAEAVATMDSSINIGGRPLADARNIDLMLFGHEEARRNCADTDSIRATPPVEDAVHFIRMAAERGHPKAMAMYPDVAFKEFDSLTALIDNADEVERRRHHAQRMLATAVRMGEPEALLASSRAYADNGWLTPDPERALAFWLAYAQTPHFKRIPETLTAERLDLLEASATPTQRSLATGQATRILQSFQGG